MSFISYAQNFEDVLLHRVFGGQETGFYVDVGAYHPVAGSVTKVFYDRGWTGINVEPASVFAELAAARPRDVNLQMAVGSRAGEVEFIENEVDRGISHVAKDEAEIGARRMVPCDTLEAIVQAHAGGRPVDFVKVDAEGAEAAIVDSTNWRRLRPRVLVLEATLPWSSTLANQEWEPVLLEQGYVRAYFDGINCFYIPEEEAPALLRHFQAPVNALDRAVHHDCDVRRTALDNQQKETTRLAAERDAFRTASDDQQKEIARLAAERDAFRMASDDQQKEIARLAAERDAVRTTSNEQQKEISRLAAERDALRMAFDNQQKETVQLAAKLDTTRSELSRSSSTVRELDARLAPLTSEPALVMTPLGPIRRKGIRWVALAAYRLIRPVARPLAWRLRGFLIGGLSDQVRHIGERLDAPSAVAPPQAQIPDYSATGEMHRLAMVMERTLLTLAMEQVPGARPDSGLGLNSCRLSGEAR
jgi:FkbM family methyltransferase